LSKIVQRTTFPPWSESPTLPFVRFYVKHKITTPRRFWVRRRANLQVTVHSPTNELGVLFLFGIVATDLGFRVERLQAAFPDCEAKREVAPGKWELVFIELEIYSRNFKLHRHNPKGCHAIVCWKHNWPDCPEWLEVIELSKVVKRLGDRE
jgi:hypothetical protein